MNDRWSWCHCHRASADYEATDLAGAYVLQNHNHDISTRCSRIPLPFLSGLQGMSNIMLKMATMGNIHTCIYFRRHVKTIILNWLLIVEVTSTVKYIYLLIFTPGMYIMIISNINLIFDMYHTAQVQCHLLNMNRLHMLNMSINWRHHSCANQMQR